MTAVIDANTLIASVADPATESAADAARALLPELAESHGLVAPSLTAWEIANVVHVKAPTVFGDDTAARARLVALLLHAIELVPPTEESIRATGSLAEAHRVTAYDAAYLELAARDEGSLLITLDSKLLKAARRAIGSRAMDPTSAWRAVEEGAL